MESLLEYCYSGLIRSCTWDKLKEVNEIETLAQAARTYGRTDLANICQLYCELGNPVTVYLNESVASLRAHFYKDMNQFLQCRSSLWPDKTITITGTDFLTKVHGPVLARIEFFRVLFRSSTFSFFTCICIPLILVIRHAGNYKQHNIAGSRRITFPEANIFFVH